MNGVGFPETDRVGKLSSTFSNRRPSLTKEITCRSALFVGLVLLGVNDLGPRDLALNSHLVLLVSRDSIAELEEWIGPVH